MPAPSVVVVVVVLVVEVCANANGAASANATVKNCFFISVIVLPAYDGFQPPFASFSYQSTIHRALAVWSLKKFYE